MSASGNVVVTLWLLAGFQVTETIAKSWRTVMTVVEIVRQSLQIGRSHKSLWLFAFVVGLGSGGGGGGGGTAGSGGAPGALVAAIVAAALVAIVAGVLMRLVSEGALIEGVSRAHRQEALSVREGFRIGWAHCGVLFRIAAIYVMATLVSIFVLAAPYVLAVRLLGRGVLVPLAIATLIVAVPWLVTLYAVQALASRIAVLEDRHALDAIRKARLFLHGRMRHALKLMVAAFVGTVFVVAVGVIAIGPFVLLLVAAARLLGTAPVAVIGALTLVPAVFVLVAFMGTVQSAAWTLGYLEQAERRS